MMSIPGQVRRWASFRRRDYLYIPGSIGPGRWFCMASSEPNFLAEANTFYNPTLIDLVGASGDPV